MKNLEVFVFIFLLRFPVFVAEVVPNEIDKVINNCTSAEDCCTLKELILGGTSKWKMKFPGIPASHRECLERIEFHYMEFDPNFFLESLEGCSNLKQLVLFNVIWNGSFNSKVYMPHLTEFSIHRSESWEWTNEYDIKYFIFFYKRFIDWERDRIYLTTTKIILNYTSIFGNSESILLYYPPTTKNESGLLYLSIDVKVGFNNFNLLKYFKNFKYQKLGFYGGLFDTTYMNPDLKVLYLNTDCRIIKPYKHISNFLNQLLTNVRELVILCWPQAQAVDFGIFGKAKELKTLGLINVRLYRKSLYELPLGQISQFYIEYGDIDIRNVAFSNELKTLELIYPENIIGNLEDTVKSAGMLKQIDLRIRPNNKLKLDLSIFNNETLETFAVQDIQLTNKQNLKFQNVADLKLTNCEMDGLIENALCDIFPNIHTFSSIVNPTGYLTYWTPPMTQPAKLQVLKQILTNTTAIKALFKTDVKPKQLFRELGMSDNSNLINSKDKIIILERQSFKSTWKLHKDPKLLTISKTKLSKYEIFKNGLFYYTYAIFVPSICALGLLGNAFCAFVLTRKVMRSTIGYILLSLTFYDTLLLVTYIPIILFKLDNLKDFYYGYTMVEYLKLIDPYVDHPVQEKICYPLNKIAYTGTIYTTILITLERYLAVCWPLKMHVVSRNSSFYLMISILIFSISFNIPRWFEAYEFFETEDHERYSLLDIPSYVEVYHSWINIIFTGVIPFTLLLFFNFKIWKSIKAANIQRNAIAQGNSNEDSITRMLILIVVIFAICNSIHFVLVMIIFIRNSDSMFAGNRPAFAESISCIPLLINSSVNFIVYYCTGSRFRNVFYSSLPKFLKFGRIANQQNRRNTNTSLSIRTTTSTVYNANIPQEVEETAF